MAIIYCYFQHYGPNVAVDSTALDQDKFLTAIIASMPLGVSSRPIASASHLSDSNLSLNSLIATFGVELRGGGQSTLTPEINRKQNSTPLQKAMTTLRDQTLFRSVSGTRGGGGGGGGARLSTGQCLLLNLT
jgi:hypothetical protein